LNAAPGPDNPHQRQRLGITGGLLLAVVLAVFFLAALESVVSRLGIEQLDGPASRFVAAHQTAAPTNVAKAVTVLGSPGFTVAVAVVAMAVLIWRFQWIEAAVFLAIAVAGGNLSYVVLKHLVHRARPPGALVHLSTFSFPSGHTVGATTLFLGLAWIVSRLRASRPVCVAAWAGALVIVVAVGATRVVLGVHYASDVIGGFALGGFWVVAAATVWGARELSRPHRSAARVTIHTQTR
jgi:membrane-associated phospholipid phosphatase